MPSQDKIKFVEDLSNKIKKSSALYFTKYTGMSVDQANELRQQFTDDSVEYMVSKNTLTKIAVEKAGLDVNQFNDFLNGQVGIAYASEDPVAPARVIKSFSKDNECLKVVGLFFDGKIYSPEKYTELANLPSKDELITKFVIGLNYPMTSLANCLQASMTNLVNVLNSLKDQKN